MDEALGRAPTTGSLPRLRGALVGLSIMLFVVACFLPSVRVDWFGAVPGVLALLFGWEALVGAVREGTWGQLLMGLGWLANLTWVATLTKPSPQRWRAAASFGLVSALLAVCPFAARQPGMDLLEGTYVWAASMFVILVAALLGARLERMDTRRYA